MLLNTRTFLITDKVLMYIKTFKCLRNHDEIRRKHENRIKNSSLSSFAIKSEKNQDNQFLTIKDTTFTCRSKS